MVARQSGEGCHSEDAIPYNIRFVRAGSVAQFDVAPFAVLLYARIERGHQERLRCFCCTTLIETGAQQRSAGSGYRVRQHRRAWREMRTDGQICG
jgi:hypothetical protein